VIAVCAQNSTDSCSESEIEIKIALLKYFASLKTFNMHVCIHKPMAWVWVWLDLPVLSSKMKT